MDREKIVGDLESTIESLKGMRDLSINMVNLSVSPEIEMQMPEEVKDLLKESRQAYNLKGEKGRMTSVKDKIQTVNDALSMVSKQAEYNRVNRQKK